MPPVLSPFPPSEPEDDGSWYPHKKYDFAYIHVEAPDEMGHQGSVEDKITAIENIDGKVGRTVVEGLRVPV